MITNRDYQYTEEDILLLKEAYEKYKAGLLTEAEKIFKHLALRYPDNAEVINDYGVCLFNNGNLRKAIPQFIKALDLRPNYKEPLFNLREAYKNLFNETTTYKDIILCSRPYVVKGIECFEGWAISESGIRDIKVYINDAFICLADLQLPRPDMASAYPQINNSSQGGYRFYVNTMKFSNGIHGLTIKITSNDGYVKEYIYCIDIQNSRLSETEYNILFQYDILEDDEPVIERSLFLPTYFSLETTVACPSNCIMCPREEVVKSRKNKFMPERFIDKIFDEVDWKCFLNWEWINDPLCDDRIYGFMRKAKKLGFDNWITTPGYLLNEYHIQRLLEGNVDVIVFSIDTLDADLYRKIRRGLELEVVLRNIRNFIEAKERLNSKAEVWVTKIQLPLTRHEDTTEFMNFFNALGIKKVQFPLYRIRGAEMDKEVTLDVPNRYKCYFIENEMAITTDGDVILCPCEAGAWDKPEANISEMSIRDAWLTRRRFQTIKLIRSKGLKAYKKCREHSGITW